MAFQILFLLNYNNKLNMKKNERTHAKNSRITTWKKSKMSERRLKKTSLFAILPHI